MTGRVWPYEHRDEDTGSTWLGISPEAGHGAKVEVLGGNWVTVTNLLPIVAALYAAAGEPEPFILHRAPMTSARHHFGDLYVWKRGCKVGIGLGAGPLEAEIPDCRALAAYLVTVQEEADEVEQAEVEELAKYLARDRSITPHDYDNARAAIRWMKRRQERQS